MLHFPVSLMNRLNQTESAIFKLCRFTVFPKESPYQIIHKTGFLLMWLFSRLRNLVPFQCRVHSPTETQSEALDMTQTLMTVVKSNSESTANNLTIQLLSSDLEGSCCHQFRVVKRQKSFVVFIIFFL